MASKHTAREITSSATPWRPPATTTAAPVHVKRERETRLYCKTLVPDAAYRWIWEVGWKLCFKAACEECRSASR